MRVRRRLVPLLLGLIVALTGLAAPLRAEEVRLEHLGLNLLANLALPPGRPLGPEGAVVIVHGTLAHHGMEIIRTLQVNLGSRGIASLAITLSLGINERRGMFDCSLEHDHRSGDAVEEVAAWVEWLRTKGAGRAALLGHSRGAAQVALYAQSDPDPFVDRLILVAPPSDSPARTGARFRQSFGADLAGLIAAARKLVDDGEEDTLIETPGFLSCPRARVTAAAFLDYYEADPKRDWLAILAAQSKPALVVSAGRDEVSPDVPALLAKAAPGPHVVQATIPDADHFFRDLFADDLADRITAFLEKPLPPISRR